MSKSRIEKKIGKEISQKIYNHLPKINPPKSKNNFSNPLEVKSNTPTTSCNSLFTNNNLKNYSKYHKFNPLNSKSIYKGSFFTAAFATVAFALAEEEFKSRVNKNEEIIIEGDKTFRKEDLQRVAMLIADMVRAYSKEYDKHIPENKYSIFIDCLVEQMQSSKTETNFNGMEYIKVGDTAFTIHADKILAQALKDADIDIKACYISPAQTEWRIYGNGQLEIYSTSITKPRSTILRLRDNADIFYDTSLLEDAKKVNIYTGKFRLLSIPLDTLSVPLNNIVYGSIEPKQSMEATLSTKKNILFCRIQLADFNGSEEEFLKLSDKEFISILQDSKKIQETFLMNRTHIIYDEDQSKFMPLDGFYRNQYKKIQTNYYQEIEQAVKIISVSEKGTAWTRTGLDEVNPGDFLISYDGKIFSILPKGFTFQECIEPDLEETNQMQI